MRKTLSTFTESLVPRNDPTFDKFLDVVMAFAAIAGILLLCSVFSPAQEVQSAITLDRSGFTGAVSEADDTLMVSGRMRGQMEAWRANFRKFTDARVSEASQPERFLLSIHQPTKLTGISATHDFRVVGGTCSEGRLYLSGAQCSVEVVFTPKGPGHRSGQLSIAHSASVKPFLIPIGGTAVGPAISFTPSVIGTVPGTFVPASQGTAAGGTLLGPQGLAVDGGDNLYIADTGNNLIKFRDSSGNLSVLMGGGTANPINYSGLRTGMKLSGPTGVAVNSFEEVAVSDAGDGVVVATLPSGVAGPILGGGTQTDPCTPLAPCGGPDNEEVSGLYGIAASGGDSFFVSLSQPGGSSPTGFSIAELNTSEEAVPDPDPTGFYYLPTLILSQYSTSRAVGVDGQESLYYPYEDPGGTSGAYGLQQCYIMEQNRALSFDQPGGVLGFIAGTPTCGFSGDEGKALGAEISSSVQGLTLDAAGNLYFTDTSNNRVRRIDANTGIIHTIAGNGTTGYGGDGGSSIKASVESPAGIAVDSAGQVYTTSYAASSGPFGQPVPAEVRMFGTIGEASFGFQNVATPSVAQTVMISNVGNDTLNFNHAAFSSGMTSDFALDPFTTSCNFNIPLPSGHNCRVGFIFTPGALGVRSAVFTITEDTAAGVHTIQLTGTGGTSATLAPANLTFANQIETTISAAQVVTLKNTGQSVLTISGMAIQGLGQGLYVRTTTCGVTLAVGAGCTISVKFAPRAAGFFPAVLVVSDNASGGQQTAALSGTAVVGTPKVVITPASINFGSTGIDAVSAVRTVTVTNTGTATLTRSGFGMQGAGATNFKVQQDCAPLEPGQSCIYQLTFTPNLVGPLSASFVVTTNAGTVSAAVSGTGVLPASALTPSSLAFASQTVATSSAARVLTFTNPALNAVIIHSMVFGGTNAGDFSQTNTCGTSVAAGSTCFVSIVFKPVAAGARAATFLLVTAGAGNLSATLTGNATAAVVKARVTLISGVNPALRGKPILFTSTVDAAIGHPTGVVQLKEGSRVLAESTLSNGPVQIVHFILSSMAAGTHTLQAVYIGDRLHPASASASILQRVNAAPLTPLAKAQDGRDPLEETPW